MPDPVAVALNVTQLVTASARALTCTARPECPAPSDSRRGIRAGHGCVGNEVLGGTAPTGRIRLADLRQDDRSNRLSEQRASRTAGRQHTGLAITADDFDVTRQAFGGDRDIAPAAERHGEHKKKEE